MRWDEMRCDVMWCDVMWCDVKWCDVTKQEMRWNEVRRDEMRERRWQNKRRNEMFCLCFCLQSRWTMWETLLSLVDWSTVSTSITGSQQPLTLLSTPKPVDTGTRTFHLLTSTATIAWLITTQQRKCCTLGTLDIKSLTPSLLRNISMLSVIALQYVGIALLNKISLNQYHFVPFTTTDLFS